MTAQVRIDVWSDYVCPFCYLEEPVLERLRHEYAERVDIVWRAFELRPEPHPTLDPDGAYLHRVWNRSVYPMAQERGMTLRLPPVQPRSRKALELAEFARTHGRFADLHRALFKTFFEDGRDLGDIDTLVEIAASVGLPADASRAVLQQGSFRDRVLADAQEAHALGISGVPIVLIRTAGAPFTDADILSGAQPYGRMKAALEHALARS